MKVAARGGHNFACPGASALIDETTEDRKVLAPTIKYMRASGVTVIDATPGNCNENTDLDFGTNTANNNKANLFMPIHFNKAFNSYNGALGTEIWLNPKNSASVATGLRILNNLVALGFKNRGLKDGTTTEHLHDIRKSNMSAVLVEVCFCEATTDVALYKSIGPDRIGKAISEGVVGHIVASSASVQTTPVVIVPATRVNNSIANLQREINIQGGHLVVDGFSGPKTIAACPMLKFGARGNITKWMQHRLALTLQDGKFGTGTQSTVKKFQTASGLKADGEVGKLTWTKLLR